ncbi:MAG: SpoIIE family protein phosphatase [Planctomycetota bacterium]|nr:SpoIIE family protein phosphatase [Planctomycetota bacterium]
MPRLVILSGSRVGSEYPVWDGLLIGRGPETDLPLREAPTVSRVHCKIVKDGEGFAVEDLQSGNGTFLNGKRVEIRAPLRHRDRIRLSDQQLLFEDEASAPNSSPGPSTLQIIDSGDAPDPSILHSIDASDHDLTRLSPTENIDLRHSYHQLRTLFTIGNTLHSVHETSQILEVVLDSIFEIFPHAERSFILLPDEESGTLNTSASRMRNAGSSPTVSVSRTLVEEVIRRKVSITFDNASQDPFLGKAASIVQHSICSVMCAPLMAQERLLGVLHVDSTHPSYQFSSSDLEILTGVASQAAMALSSAETYQLLFDRQRIEQDLEFARQVQESFLPGNLPDLPGWSIATWYQPARKVGGDFYDVIELPDNRVALVVADVSGKGVPAALLMARISSEIRSLTLSDPAPDTVLSRMSRLLQDRPLTGGMFVTLLYLLLDLESGQVHLSNAGHLPLLRALPDKSCVFVEEGGNIPLGIFDMDEYESVSFQTQPGERLILFTDGVAEAVTHEGDRLGLDGLERIVTDAPNDPVRLCGALREDFRISMDPNAFLDDLTLLCIGRNPEAL